jgi:hypothetical protein
MEQNTALPFELAGESSRNIQDRHRKQLATGQSKQLSRKQLPRLGAMLAINT